MKTHILEILAAGFLTFSSFAGATDSLVVYRSTGPDKYADGSVVKDGEAYALVYTRPGFEFEGFNEDATCRGTNSETVIVAPLAREGRCAPTLFQLDETYVSSRKNGRWSVHLLDTRDDNGNLTIVHINGFIVMPKVRCWSADSIPVRVADSMTAAKNLETNILRATEWFNGVPSIPSGVSAGPEDDGRGPLPVILTTNDVNEADCPETIAGDGREAASDPGPAVDEIPAPVITSLTFEGDTAVLTAANTKAGCRYYVMFAEDLRKEFKKTGGYEVPRYDNIVLRFKINVKNKKSGFFKIYVDRK